MYKIPKFIFDNTYKIPKFFLSKLYGIPKFDSDNKSCWRSAAPSGLKTLCNEQ